MCSLHFCYTFSLLRWIVKNVTILGDLTPFTVVHWLLPSASVPPAVTAHHFPASWSSAKTLLGPLQCHSISPPVSRGLRVLSYGCGSFKGCGNLAKGFFFNKWVVKARLQWFCLSSGLSQHTVWCSFEVILRVVSGQKSDHTVQIIQKQKERIDQ